MNFLFKLQLHFINTTFSKLSKQILKPTWDTKNGELRILKYLIRGKAGNLGGRGRERRRGGCGREACAVVDVALVGAPEAADAGGQLLGPEDPVGDVEERVGRRRGGGRDGAAPGAALSSRI